MNSLQKLTGSIDSGSTMAGSAVSGGLPPTVTTLADLVSWITYRLGSL